MVNKLLQFIDASPVNFLAVKNITETLEKNGFRHMDATLPLGQIKPGDAFFVTKNDSSIYAFRMGKKPLAEGGFHIICSHCDSPCFRIKPNAEMIGENGILRLNTEVYGGAVLSTWFDRPLSLAGRVIIRTEDPLQPLTRLIHIKRPLLQISNLAIHFNRQVNDGVKLSKQKDMLPVLGILLACFMTKRVSSDMMMPEYVISLVEPLMDAHLIAAITFIVIAALTFVTSSFWGIEIIAISIVVPLAIAVGGNILLVLGAVVSGGVFGSHACFYADATVLSSSTCNIDNISHAVTQLPYALIGATIATLGFVVMGYVL